VVFGGRAWCSTEGTYETDLHLVVLFWLCSVFASGEKAASAFVLKDTDMTVSNPEAPQKPILGSHCGVSARGVLTDYLRTGVLPAGNTC